MVVFAVVLDASVDVQGERDDVHSWVPALNRFPERLSLFILGPVTPGVTV